MERPQNVTLFIGSDPDSGQALEIVKNFPFGLKVVDCNIVECDFETPLLISSWGVFDDLNSIIWFGQVASQNLLKPA
jgi:hypothetical protein